MGKMLLRKAGACLLLPVLLAGAAPYTWANVAIGGGGYVTNLVIHPKEKDLFYTRTDVGGAYRFDPQGKRWIPLTDFLSREEKNMYGIAGMALDENDPDVIYLAAGMFRGHQPSDVLKSTDRGATWKRTNLNKAFHGNEIPNYRYYGECVQVDPFNGDIVFAGTMDDGLWISGDAGESWRLMDGSPEIPARMAVTRAGALYVTSKSGFFRYRAGAWTNLSPVEDARFCPLSIDPSDENIIMVGYDRGPNQWNLNTIYRSLDGGSIWTEMVQTADFKSNVPWWKPINFSQATANVVIDPHNTKRVWFADFLGAWVTEDITETPKQKWTTYEEGREELVVFDLACTPAGAPVFSGVADMDGFRHTDLTRFPQSNYKGFGDTVSIAYCEEDPSYMARVGVLNRSGETGIGKGAYSTDNGMTWTEFESLPKGGDGIPIRFGRIAVSAKKNPQTGVPTLLIAPIKAPVMVSKDNGKTWVEAQGAPDLFANGFWNYNRLIAADSVNPEKFYGLGNGRFYRSTDGGLTFSEIPDVSEAVLFSFGKEAPGSWLPTIYLYGKVEGASGIFRSVNGGASWVKINDDSNKIGCDPTVMEADRQTFGKVYIGTSGRGVFYGTPAEAPFEAGENRAAAVNEQAVALDVPPCVIDGRVMIPLRFIAESLGAAVDWSEGENTVYIMQ